MGIFFGPRGGIEFAYSRMDVTGISLNCLLPRTPPPLLPLKPVEWLSDGPGKGKGGPINPVQR